MYEIRIHQPAGPSTASDPSYPFPHLNFAEIDRLISEMLKRFRYMVPDYSRSKAPFDEKDSTNQKMEYPTVDKLLDNEEEDFLLLSTHQLIASFLEKKAEEFEPELMLAAFSIAQKLAYDNPYGLNRLFLLDPPHKKKVIDLERKCLDIVVFKTETTTLQTPALLEPTTALTSLSSEDLSEKEIALRAQKLAKIRDELYSSLSTSLANITTKIDNPASLSSNQLENLKYAYDFALNLADLYEPDTTSKTRISSSVASSPALTVIDLETPNSWQESIQLSTLAASSPSLITPWPAVTNSSMGSSPLSPTRKGTRVLAEQQLNVTINANFRNKPADPNFATAVSEVSPERLISKQTEHILPKPRPSSPKNAYCCRYFWPFRQKKSAVTPAATQDPSLNL